MGIKYSEIFKSIQGEGQYTGVPTLWVRFFGCNLTCDGFGQIDPTDKSTYKLPYKDFDLSSIKKIDDLPVWPYGCDSSYSWAAKYKNIQHDESAPKIAKKLISLLPYETFFNSWGQTDTHLCFTGGEPLLPVNQKAAISILDSLHTELLTKLTEQFLGLYSTEEDVCTLPASITFETNGTQAISPDLINMFRDGKMYGSELFLSISPKILSTSGESFKRAIKPSVIFSNFMTEIPKFVRGQLKFVVDGSNRSWDDVDAAIEQFRKVDIQFPVWIMKVGATKEGQTGELKNYMTEAEVCNAAIERGFNYSTRAHVHIFGNKLGT